MNESEIATLDWQKGEGLIPAIVQHAETGAVLMLGYMDRAALQITIDSKRATFFSRSRGRLWTKGETSGHFVAVDTVATDCDRDALLVLGRPRGPVCHTGSVTCFSGAPLPRTADFEFLRQLENVIAERIREQPESSYVAKLCASGPARLAQKVGEEALEVALAAVSQDSAAVIGESADLLFHLMVLLTSRGTSLREVVVELGLRHERTA